MENPLPIISPEPLDPHLLEDCAQGSCSQCGLCCIGYKITVPGVRGDIDSSPYHKERGEVCPQLIRDARGKYLCALHDEKMAGDPRLAVCREWNGNRNRLVEIAVLTEAWGMKPYDLRSVETLRDMIHRGLSSILDFEVTDANVADIVLHYIVRLHICPEDIFDALGIRRIVKHLYHEEPAEYQKLDRALWEHSEEMYGQFFHQYVWSGATPDAELSRELAFGTP